MKACTKVRYDTELDANTALVGIQKKDASRRPKLEQRTYHCGTCGGWHLTSMRLGVTQPSVDRPASPVDAVTEAWPRDLAPVLKAVQDERRAHEIELACTAEGHAYFRDGADPIHGVVGFCACGAELYNIADGSPLA